MDCTRPYGWIGDRPERTRNSYKKTKAIADILLKPYVEEFRTVHPLYAKLEEAYLIYRDGEKSSEKSSDAEEAKRNYQIMQAYMMWLMENTNPDWIKNATTFDFPIPEEVKTECKNIVSQNERIVPRQIYKYSELVMPLCEENKE
jgi:hypothetical protein